MFKGTQNGLFWLHDRPEHKAEGTLDFHGSGKLQLTTRSLLDSFDDGSESKSIRGVTANGYVTLVDAECFRREEKFNAYITGSEEAWHCQYAFQGLQEGVENLENLNKGISSVAVEIELLTDWAHIRVHFDRDWNLHRGSFSWSVEQPGRSSEWSLGKIEVRHSVVPSFTPNAGRIRSVKVSTNTSFIVKFERTQNLDAALSAITSLQALVSVAKGEAAAIERVSLGLKNSETDFWVTFHYEPTLKPDPIATKSSELFSLEELGGMKGVGKWMDVQQGQSILKNALLIDRYRPPTFVTDRIGHLLMAHEAYQRHSTNRHKGQLSLKHVLPPIPKRIGDGFLDWIGDWEVWRKTISRIRSEQIAHLQNFGKNWVGEGIVQQVNDQLYALLIIRILNRCSFSEELLEQVLKRSRSKSLVRL